MDLPWRLEQRRATLKLGPLDADIDLDQPALGLERLKLGGCAITPARLLGVELPPSNAAGDRLVETYLRGDDLIATYADTAQPSFRWQIYWRAVLQRFPQALAAIETIVSVQTGLLDSRPQLMLRSAVPCSRAAVWRATIGNGELSCERFDPGSTAKTIGAAEGWGCFGFELSGVAASYVEMVHPADFDSSMAEAVEAPFGQADRAGGVALRHRLFGERLEKGVILRSRVLGLLLPDWPTLGTIADVRHTFVDEGLPLTT
ncbi:MAG TPA: hypothetical protein VHY91_25855 [Pirellulales bacterium]|nr:hypothetical protein [Pirellulales bacterium]